jgi:hypothetical protein
LAKCKLIVAALDKLQKDCTGTHDSITLELDGFKNDLTEEAKQKAVDIKNLEEKLKNVGCVNSFWDLCKAIGSLGISCAFKSNLENELNDAKRKL